jgi:hypothetical protein
MVKMLVLPTDEQLLLKKTTESLAGDHALSSPKDLDGFDRARTWNALASAGLLGLRSVDGAESPLASGVDVMIVVESLAARLVPVPYIGSAVMSQELLRVTGAPASWSSGLADGSVRCAVLLASDFIDIGSRDRLDRSFAYDAWDSARLLCVGEDGGQRTLECWEVQSLQPLDWIDLTRTVSRVVLGEHCGRVPLSETAWSRWTTMSLVAASADMLGAMGGALAGAVEYAKQREQFGVPIGKFQAVQHLCAEAHVSVQASRSLLNFAAWAVDELDPGEALLAARTAKAYTSRVARGVCETVMQVYGGIGQTWEAVAHLYLRRVLGSRELLGSENSQHAAIADLRLRSA